MSTQIEDVAVIERHTETINRFLATHIDGEIVQLTVRLASGSPWIQLDLWLHLRGERKYALWVETGNVYDVDEHGAASDDPIWSPR